MNNAHSPLRKAWKVFLLGALVAGVFWAVQGPPDHRGELPEIFVTEAEVAHQRARWERTWGRPPTSAELRKAVDRHIRNEILYREALARDMDREDPRVRLALIQKMQMLAAGQADARGVTEKDLAAFFALRQEQYRIPARLSLTQVFFKDATNAQARAEKLQAQFQEQEPAEGALREAGDTTMLDVSHRNVTALDLEKQFGTDFTAEVLSLPDSKWSGPVRSVYGLHLVKVFDRIPGRMPELAEVRETVESDLMYEVTRAAQEQGYQEIAGKYRVRINNGAKQMLAGETQ